MTQEEYHNVKYGDILTYASNDGTVLVKVRDKYSFAGGGRIVADTISEDSEFKDCDAPYSCFELIHF